MTKREHFEAMSDAELVDCVVSGRDPADRIVMRDREAVIDALAGLNPDAPWIEPDQPCACGRGVKPSGRNFCDICIMEKFAIDPATTNIEHDQARERRPDTNDDRREARERGERWR